MKKYIPCLGADNIIHFCIPYENECLCGMQIKHKINNLTGKQILKYGWCGYCETRDFDSGSEE